MMLMRRVGSQEQDSETPLDNNKGLSPNVA